MAATPSCSKFTSNPLGYARVLYFSGTHRPHFCEWIVPGTLSWDYDVPKPFDQAAHDHLISVGYTYERIAADHDDGDAENGPGTWGHPAYDVYSTEDETVGIDESGEAGHEILDPLGDWHGRNE